MMSKMCMAAILCSGDSVFAQTIFKQVDATGRTTFSDRPSAEGGVPYLSYPGPERDSVPPLAIQARSDVQQALFTHTSMRSMHAATIDFNEARRRLAQARQSRRDGIEAQPGERADVGGSLSSARPIRFGFSARGARDRGLLRVRDQGVRFHMPREQRRDGSEGDLRC